MVLRLAPPLLDVGGELAFGRVGEVAGLVELRQLSGRRTCDGLIEEAEVCNGLITLSLELSRLGEVRVPLLVRDQALGARVLGLQLRVIDALQVADVGRLSTGRHVSLSRRSRRSSSTAR